MEKSGAEIILECLKKEGVKHVFGYPGGAVLHIYDAFDQQDDVMHILARHEQGALHAADGYARSTGKPGVALVTSGPGATNAVTGIATAYMDSIPLVVITGQVSVPAIGSDAFQEVDAVGITRPCVKHNFLVNNVDELATTIKKAFYIATSGRPGPVVIDVPKDVSAQKTIFDYPEHIDIRSYKPTERGHIGQIKKAFKLLRKSERPVIYSGGGIILGQAHQELAAFARRTGFPVTQTLMGLGGYPASDPQFLGMLGMHGTYEANMVMHHSDLVLAIGARFDDRVTGNIEKFCPQAAIIHVDIDPSSIAKTVKVDVPIVGHVRLVLEQMLEIMDEKGFMSPDHEQLAPWWQQIEQWRKANCLRYDKDSGVIKPQSVIETLYEVTQGDAFITSDVGQHQMWAAQFYKFDKPHRWINSGGLGTMGFGIPAAMGVQLAHPEANVACITGDASVMMCIQELSTCLQYGLPLKIVLLNNRFMGMVRQWQEFFHGKRYAMSYMDALPDFLRLAESFGHIGMRIENPGDVKPAMQEAFSMRDRLVFMEIITDETENVYPMIAAGAGHNEMILV